MVTKILTVLSNIFHLHVQLSRHVTEVGKDDKASKYTGERVCYTDYHRVSVEVKVRRVRGVSQYMYTKWYRHPI